MAPKAPSKSFETGIPAIAKAESAGNESAVDALKKGTKNAMGSIELAIAEGAERAKDAKATADLLAQLGRDPEEVERVNNLKSGKDTLSPVEKAAGIVPGSRAVIEQSPAYVLASIQNDPLFTRSGGNYMGSTTAL